MARQGIFAGIGARIQQIVRGNRGPEQSRVADIGPQRRQPSPDEARRVLDSWEALAGRVSPDAGPTRDRWALWLADDLTPEVIINAQRAAVTSGQPLQWVELIDQIYSRDGHYSSVTSQRVADVMRGRWTFRRNGNDDAADIALAFAQEVQRRVHRWRDGLGWLLYANLYGYNAVEIEWEEADISFAGPNGKTIGPFRAALPKRLHNVHPKHFRFSTDVASEDDPLFWIGSNHEPLPLGKFIFMDGDGLHPLKVRHGHAWQCVWYSLFRSVAWSSWATRVNRFDMPIPMMGYEGGLAQYAEYKAAMIDIDKSLGSGKGIRYPKNDMTLEIASPPGGGTANDPQSALAGACDVGQTIRVLGAELVNTQGNTGSFAAKSQDVATKYNLEDWDAARLAERIDEQFTAPLVLFNAEALATAANLAGYNVTPDQLTARCPLGKQAVPREMTPQIRATVLGMLVDKGMPISMEGEFDNFDFQRARNAEDRIPGEAQTVAAGAALKTAADAADPDTAKNEDTAGIAAAAPVTSTPSAPPVD